MTEKRLKVVIKEANKATNNVFYKHYEVKDKEISYEDIAIMGLFDEAIEKCETILFLINNEIFAGTESLVRVVLEHYAFLKYIIAKDTKKRGKAYILSDTISSKKIFDISISNSKEGTDIRKFLGYTKNDVKEMAINTNLSEEKFSKLKEEYYECFSIDKPRSWHDNDGSTKSFEALCRKLNLLNEYNLVYRIFSRDTHAAKASEKFKQDYDSGKMFLVKSTINIDSITIIASSLLFDMIVLIYDYYDLETDKKLMKTNLTLNF